MESIMDVLSNGLKTVKNNKVLFIPGAVFGIFSILLTALIVLVAYFLDSMSENVGINVAIILFAFICFLLLNFILFAYVTAGITGMAKEAAATGKTGMVHFWAYAKQFFKRILMVKIIFFLLAAASLIFFIPVFYIIIEAVLNNSMDGFFSKLGMLIGFMRIGFVLTLIYLLILYVLFFFIGCNTVVDNFSVIESYKKSVSLLKEKTFRVMAFIIIYFIIYIGLFLLVEVFARIAISLVLSLIVPINDLMFVRLYVEPPISSSLRMIFNMIFMTVSTVLITRFYMATTEKPLYVKENYVGGNYVEEKSVEENSVEENDVGENLTNN